MSSQILNSFSDRYSTTSLGNLCHCLTTFIVQKKHHQNQQLIFKFQFPVLPLVLSLGIIEKSLPPFALLPCMVHQIFTHTCKIPQSLIFSNLSSSRSHSLSLLHHLIFFFFSLIYSILSISSALWKVVFNTLPQVYLNNVEQRGGITCLDLLAILCLMQP